MKGCLELDLNEMPYPPPDSVVAAARHGLEELNRYSQQAALSRLAECLAEYAGAPVEQLVVGPGSDLLLRESVMCFGAGRKVVMASPSFLPTVQVARRFAAKLVNIRLSPPGFCLGKRALLEELGEPCLVILDNPNNPTGRLLLDRETVEQILRQPDTLLIVDEAYFEFSGLSFAGLVTDHANLAVTRTLDKAFALAGARVGYLIAGRAFRDTLGAFYAFLPQPSLQAALEALRQRGYMWKNVRLIVQERERLRQELQLLGLAVYPSNTNFLLLKADSPGLAGDLQEEGVLVLDLSDQLGPGYVRVTVGAPEQNDCLVRACRTVSGRREQGRQQAQCPKGGV